MSKSLGVQQSRCSLKAPSTLQASNAASIPSRRSKLFRAGSGGVRVVRASWVDSIPPLTHLTVNAEVWKCDLEKARENGRADERSSYETRGDLI